MTTYFVSSEIGSNNNAGTSESAPLASLQAAANLVQPGDTVEVMNGTYTGPSFGDVVDITTSGTASAPITFEAAPGQTPVINSSGSWNAINIKASYIVINGFTVVGDAANYTLSQALAGYSTGNANLDGNGIVVNSPGGGAVPNHIIIENNTVSNEPGGGIGTQGADYVQILNNVVHDNAHWSAFGNSGISVNISANSDTNSGVHTTISGNLVYGNAQLVPTNGASAGTITDGEGIILDTNPGFVGEMLVENNTVHGNGSSGIESFKTDNAVITSNTVYGNNVNSVVAASNAEIFINQSNNNTVTNNTTTATDAAAPAAPAISTGVANTDESVTLTGTAPGGSTVTVSGGSSTSPGTTTATSSGTWSYTTPSDLTAGTYAFTATDTTSAGTSVASNELDVTVPDSSSQPSSGSSSSGSSSQPSGSNLVVNGNFATNSFSGWTLGGNDGPDAFGQPIVINTEGQGGSQHAADLGSIGSDGTISQTIATTPGQTYTLSFWLQNQGSGPNDFAAIWNGQTQLALSNAAAFGYTEYTYTVTATSSSTVLEFSARQDPSHWDLDNISLTANGTSSTSTPTDPPPSPSGANLVVNGNFATNSFSGWTLGGNDGPDAFGQPIVINTEGQGGSQHAADLGSIGSDGTISQTIATTPGQTYTLSFWLQNEGAGPNDFSTIWNGQTLLSLSNAAAFGYTEHTYTVTATGSSTVLEFSARQDPSHWDLDNISLTANGTSSTSTPTDPPPAPAVQSGAVNIVGTDPTVTLTGTAPDGATVTVSDGGSTPLGSTTASSSGAWSFTTPDLPAGNYAFTVTDTTPIGTTTTSNPFDVTVPTPSAGGGASGLPRIAFDPPTTLGSWSSSNQTRNTSSFADIAVLGNHIASSFALPSGSQGGTMVNSESTPFGTQPLVANPHHA